ncbi:MAG: DUF1080 domain-containing protein [Bacteroidetes bacterium]|nr:DUF1080 domain-containing protein [Bacteroidota bacterium]
MKKPFAFILIAVLTTLLACQKSAKNDDQNSEAVMNMLTDEEKASGWELLFDGKTLNGWKRYNHDTIGPLWSVRDSAIMCNGEGLGEGSKAAAGSLMTIKQYSNFELTLEWKLSPKGNSGILYHVVEKPELKHDYESGPECQILDDPAYVGQINDAQRAGSNYDMYPAAADRKVNPPGQWNSVRIIYNNGHVEHWLNGQKVVEFQEGTQDYQERFKKSKWVDYPQWNQSNTGSISLQDHGAPVYFRNIKIKVL